MILLLNINFFLLILCYLKLTLFYTFLEHKIEILVRYSETDQMSFVHHANYVKYFEMGRIAWLKNKGISYKDMEDNGIINPVIDLQINFRKPALFDDKLILTTSLKQSPSYMIEFNYQIHREKELLTHGYTRLIFLNSENKKPIRCPDYILEKIKMA